MSLTIYYTKDSQRNATAKAKCYVTSSMRKDLVQEVGFQGYTLFEHILNRKASKHKPMTDDTLADELGTSKRTVQRARIELEKNHWYLARKTKHIVEYFIGKKSVMDAVLGEVELPTAVKLACRTKALKLAGITDATENTTEFLAEFGYLKTKAEQWLRAGYCEKETIQIIEEANKETK